MEKNMFFPKQIVDGEDFSMKYGKLMFFHGKLKLSQVLYLHF